jgi:hypothetical protein
MASIHRTASGAYAISFRYGGRQFMKSLKTRNRDEADGQRRKIELTLSEIERGRLVVPDGADLWHFVQSDGKRTQAPKFEPVHTLSELFARYFDGGSFKEENTLATERIHRRHPERVIGARSPLKLLTPADVQRYINARAKEQYRRRPIGTRTIQKEVATLKMVLNRAEKIVGVKPPDGLFKGLAYPKATDKSSFHTWAEVERKVKSGCRRTR